VGVFAREFAVDEDGRLHLARKQFGESAVLVRADGHELVCGIFGELQLDESVVLLTLDSLLVVLHFEHERVAILRGVECECVFTECAALVELDRSDFSRNLQFTQGVEVEQSRQVGHVAGG